VVAFAGGFRAPFARYWVSGFAANFGDGVQLVAFPLLAAQVTRSPAAVAAVTAVQGLPWLVLGAGLGVLVDRTDRRLLMVVVDVTRAVIIAGLAAAILVHSAGLVLIYITAFATGPVLCCATPPRRPACRAWSSQPTWTGPTRG
jgi:MFS family permease